MSAACIATELSLSLLTVYTKKYAHGFCFAVLCCGYTLTDFPISIRLTSLVLWQSNDCPSASKATLVNMDKYFMWIHYERLHNHNKAKLNKTVCIFLGMYCIMDQLITKWYCRPISNHRPLTGYVKLLDAHSPGMPVIFSPPPASKETASYRHRHASRHVRNARYMSGSLIRGGEEDVSGVPFLTDRPWQNDRTPI